MAICTRSNLTLQSKTWPELAAMQCATASKLSVHGKACNAEIVFHPGSSCHIIPKSAQSVSQLEQNVQKLGTWGVYSGSIYSFSLGIHVLLANCERLRNLQHNTCSMDSPPFRNDGRQKVNITWGHRQVNVSSLTHHMQLILMTFNKAHVSSFISTDMLPFHTSLPHILLWDVTVVLGVNLRLFVCMHAHIAIL